MAKKRVPIDEDDDFEGEGNPQLSCTTMDHVYPNTNPNAKCYCGKRTLRPFIALDDYLKPGMIIRTTPGGPLYEVEMVNKSRARCRIVSAQAALNRRETDQEDDSGPLLMPIPGSEEWDEAIARVSSVDEEEQRGKVINISPQSACIRVSRVELEAETQPKTRSEVMAKTAGIPVAGGAGKTVAQKNKERLAKLATKPAGTARPLSGAAAKAKASARPKAQKTVRPCGCGCGGETTAYFVPGHDARFKGWIKKVGDGRMTLDELKKAMGQKQFGKYAFKKAGDGFVTKTSYQEAAEA